LAIAGISLLVGGIGIMNIMLATVTERTREIGIRRALGAKRHDITRQFLVECIVLSVVGGIVGIIAGFLASPVIVGLRRFLQSSAPSLMEAAPDSIKTMVPIVVPWSIPLAFAICTSVLKSRDASVARLCRRLGGPSYSFTIHGPSEWIDPHGLELGAKSAEASFVACISHYTGAQLRRFCDPDHWHKIEIVRCGIDSRFLDDPPSPDPASMTLICVGRLCPEKAQLVLLDAFAALLDDHPSARLVLCGDGEMRPQVERRIDELGIAHAIEITGWVDSHEVHRRLSGARALVLPSFAEGLPVVIMEAFALARPAITTYIAGIPELVRDGHNGWLIPAGDHAALRDALASCLDADSQAIREMGDAAREAVIAQHHADTAARPLIRRLRSILGLPGVRAGADVATQSDGAELGQDRPDPVIGARGG